MFPLSIHTYFELGALLAAIIYWGRLKHTPLRWLLPFLIFIVAVEMAGRYIRTVLHEPNSWLYNLSVPVEFLFYGFVFYSYYQRPVFKKAAGYFLGIFLVFTIVNLLFFQGFSIFNTHTMALGNFYMVLLGGLYFVELLKKEEPVNILKEPMFWLTTGIFLFNAGEFSYTLFLDYLYITDLDSARKIFAEINNKLIWVLYTCITIAILCSEKKPHKA
jgi:hypothetical protein